MKMITVPELQRNPEACIDAARAEDVFVVKCGKPVAKLVAVDDGEDVRKNSAPGNQIEEPEQQKAGGHGVPELVPEWVDGQEYPQGEDEPVDDGTNVPSYGNQKEEPNQYNIG